MWIILIGLGIALPLLLLGAKAIFWILAFADYAILIGVSIFFTRFQWEWHAVATILIAIAIGGLYYLLLQVPVVKYLLPIAALGFISWAVINTVNEIRVELSAEPLDLVWTVTLIILSAGILIGSRFYAVGELDLD